MARPRLSHVKRFCVALTGGHGPSLAHDPDALSQRAAACAELAVEVGDHLPQEAPETTRGCESSSYKPKSDQQVGSPQSYSQGSSLH